MSNPKIAVRIAVGVMLVLLALPIGGVAADADDGRRTAPFDAGRACAWSPYSYGWRNPYVCVMTGDSSYVPPWEVAAAELARNGILRVGGLGSPGVNYQGGCRLCDVEVRGVGVVTVARSLVAIAPESSGSLTVSAVVTGATSDDAAPVCLVVSGQTPACTSEPVFRNASLSVTTEVTEGQVIWASVEIGSTPQLLPALPYGPPAWAMVESVAYAVTPGA